MTSLEIDALENAGRTAMVWVPEPSARPDRRTAYLGIILALGVLAVAGVLLSLVM